MPLPSALVEPVRAAFVASGFPPASVGPDGSIDPAAVMSGVFNTIEIQTRATPPVTIDTASLAQGGPPNPLVQFLRPTIILRGKQGTTTIAPYGAAGDGTAGGLALVAALIGVGIVIGRFTAR